VFPFVPPEGIAVSRLAELARVRKQSMAQAVDQLERTGYVERRPNPADRRSLLVFLTERGASVTPVTHAAAEQVEKRWAQLTSPAEFAELRAALLRLLTELGPDPHKPILAIKTDAGSPANPLGRIIGLSCTFVGTVSRSRRPGGPAARAIASVRASGP
jgi:DNA-binding MarR family transcriptional regulator